MDDDDSRELKYPDWAQFLLMHDLKHLKELDDLTLKDIEERKDSREKIKKNETADEGDTDE